MKRCVPNCDQTDSQRMVREKVKTNLAFIPDFLTPVE